MNLSLVNLGGALTVKGGDQELLILNVKLYRQELKVTIQN
jgi:hypothetical protein